MKWKRFLIVLVLIVLVAGEIGYYIYSSYRQEANKPVYIDLNARSAVIMDANTGKILYAKNPDDKLQPASTVKVMTAVIAIENAVPQAQIIPRTSVKRIEPTLAGIKPGVAYSISDLVYAILIKSANDAALAIAEGVAPAQADFVDLMNKKAKEIGMSNTNFTSPSGLPARPPRNQYSTARDLAVMMRYALRYTFISEAMAKRTMDIYGSDKKRILLKTHNRALYSKDSVSIGKTGYTRMARRTFVGAAPMERPVIVFSLMRSDELWKDVRKLETIGLMLYEKQKRSKLEDFIFWFKEDIKKKWELLKSVFLRQGKLKT